MRTQRPLAAATAVYQEASSVYWQAFAPLVTIAGIFALAFNFVVFYTPPFVPYAVPWGILVNLTGVTLLASTLLVPLITGARSGRNVEGMTASAIREHGWHIAATTFILLLANAFLIVTFFGLAPAVFLTVRLAFVSVSSVVEDQDISDSLARSWELTDGVWARTAGVLLGAVAPMALLLLVLSLIGPPWIVTVIVTAIAEALVVPFVVVVLVIMFDEYRALHPEPDDFGPRQRPPFR